MSIKQCVEADLLVGNGLNATMAVGDRPVQLPIRNIAERRQECGLRSAASHRLLEHTLCMRTFRPESMSSKHKTVVLPQGNKVDGRGPLMKKIDASPKIRSARLVG